MRAVRLCSRLAKSHRCFSSLMENRRHKHDMSDFPMITDSNVKSTEINGLSAKKFRFVVESEGMLNYWASKNQRKGNHAHIRAKKKDYRKSDSKNQWMPLKAWITQNLALGVTIGRPLSMMDGLPVMAALMTDHSITDDMFESDTEEHTVQSQIAEMRRLIDQCPFADDPSLSEGSRLRLITLMDLITAVRILDFFFHQQSSSWLNLTFGFTNINSLKIGHPFDYFDESTHVSTKINGGDPCLNHNHKVNSSDIIEMVLSDGLLNQELAERKILRSLFHLWECLVKQHINADQLGSLVNDHVSLKSFNLHSITDDDLSQIIWHALSEIIRPCHKLRKRQIHRDPKNQLSDEWSKDELVLYEDRDILVVNKPSGVTSHVSRDLVKYIRQNLLSHLMFLCPDLRVYQRSHIIMSANKTTNVMIGSHEGWNRVIQSGMVHRLDRQTSGILVMAKNEESVMNLRKQWLMLSDVDHDSCDRDNYDDDDDDENEEGIAMYGSSKTIKRSYLALLHGKLDPQSLKPKLMDDNWQIYNDNILDLLNHLSQMTNTDMKLTFDQVSPDSDHHQSAILNDGKSIRLSTWFGPAETTDELTIKSRKRVALKTDEMFDRLNQIKHRFIKQPKQMNHQSRLIHMYRPMVSHFHINHHYSMRWSDAITAYVQHCHRIFITESNKIISNESSSLIHHYCQMIESYLQRTIEQKYYSRRTKMIRGEKEYDCHPLTLVECVLDTGRTHQIRLHSQMLGLSIVGERMYARQGSVRVMSDEYKKKSSNKKVINKDPFSYSKDECFELPIDLIAEHLILGDKDAIKLCQTMMMIHDENKNDLWSAIQQHFEQSDPFGNNDFHCLHAQSLSFIHPRSLERLSFHTPIPHCFRSILNNLNSISQS